MKILLVTYTVYFHIKTTREVTIVISVVYADQIKMSITKQKLLKHIKMSLKKYKSSWCALIKHQLPSSPPCNNNNCKNVHFTQQSKEAPDQLFWRTYHDNLVTLSFVVALLWQRLHLLIYRPNVSFQGLFCLFIFQTKSLNVLYTARSTNTMASTGPNTVSDLQEDLLFE